MVETRNSKLTFTQRMASDRTTTNPVHTTGKRRLQMSKTKPRKKYTPIHQTLDEKINKLLFPFSESNPPTVTPGTDPYLEIAAKALGMTYVDARKKLSNGNVAVLSARMSVKNKLFAISSGGNATSWPPR